jgi:uncharacterized protein YndB with AHSA1/START domain
MTTAHAQTRYDHAAIEADPTVPMIHIWRDFAAKDADILDWDATNNGKWRYRVGEGEDAQYFRGSFHTVSRERIVQTFTWEGMPDGVALETLGFEDLGDGRTRLHATSLCDSFEARDAWLRSGMETGVNDGYAKLDALLADGSL